MLCPAVPEASGESAFHDTQTRGEGLHDKGGETLETPSKR